MSKTNTVSPLRQRMIEDMVARKLNPHTQRSHLSSCKRFAAWLKHSPNTATPDEVRRQMAPWEGLVDLMLLYCPPALIMDPAETRATHESIIEAFAG